MVDLRMDDVLIGEFVVVVAEEVGIAVELYLKLV